MPGDPASDATAPGGARRSPFSFAAGVLTVASELDTVSQVALEEEMTRLASPDVPAPVLDLAQISYVPSMHIPGIRLCADACARSGRQMTIRARRNVRIMLERMGLGLVARLLDAERR
jgi:anti-anti-sigma regulatory factor